VPDSVPGAVPASLGIRPAIERLVLMLPPKERASVLLKEVVDYSLEEIAALIGSSVGGVKAALHRGRTKLTTPPVPPMISRTKNLEEIRVMQLYVERFNRRDRDALRELISADAH